jgi:arylsulfatase
MPNGKANILILWGDDIGQSNLSCYSHGLMGYQTPNIDRLATEGAKFIHYYAEQSCTAGRAEDPTIAEHLPTMHGFDEFFGNLYHLNAEEEPELRDYPKEDDPEFPNFRQRFAPRGVLHCWANGDGSQRIESTGPLTRKRMETADDEFLAEAKRFIRDAVVTGEPFFVWFNTTHMHFRTYARPQDVGRT